MAAQAAHLLVVNHALLLSDVAAEGRVLPEYSYLIVDEGHHLESATTAALSFRVTHADLERMLKEIGGSTSGILTRFMGPVKESMSPSALGQLQAQLTRSTDVAFRFEQLASEFFRGLADFVSGLREGAQSSQYAWQARLLPSTRLLQGWDAVEIAWESAGESLRLFLSTLFDVQQIAASADTGQSADLQDVITDLGTAARRLGEVEQQLTAMISKPAAERIYWIEVRAASSGIILNAAPLHVGPLIERFLWHEKAAMIVTSATLTTHGEFQYLRNTLGADEAAELQLGSPFDYESSTLLFVANDMPEPNAPDYQQHLHRALIATARAAGGRTLALFTSYAALKKASQSITAPLAREDIIVYEQGEGASPNALLESFRATDRAVLLGTRSFWEGVDVPGEALSVLLIPKLPFDVPTDPLVAARAETYEDPFSEYYVPEAILRFRQGFGRLIRAASDRGVVAILDRRVLSKQYGRLFLDSLPRCTMRQGPAASLPVETAKWLRT
jgi:DNA polymerase-3 subunit epsilon/ATP-dependent DNA helicase DinG